MDSRLASQHRFQALAFDEVEEFEGCATRLLVTCLPLLHRGHTGVEHRGKHRLAQVRLFAQRSDLLRHQLVDAKMAQGIKFTHRQSVFQLAVIT